MMGGRAFLQMDKFSPICEHLSQNTLQIKGSGCVKTTAMVHMPMQINTSLSKLLEAGKVNCFIGNWQVNSQTQSSC